MMGYILVKKTIIFARKSLLSADFSLCWWLEWLFPFSWIFHAMADRFQ
jgi:hypothetical protein